MAMPNGNDANLDLIPEARREIIRLLKRRGPLPVADIAEALAVTVSGARQHLSSLERDGVVTYQRVPSGKAQDARATCTSSPSAATRSSLAARPS